MNSRKKLIIISLAALGIFISIIIAVSIVYVNVYQKKEAKNTEVVIEKYTDPGSGEVMYSTKGQKGVSGPSSTGGIVFFGIKNLTDRGLSSQQTKEIIRYFIYYKKIKDPKVEEISITTSSIKKNEARKSNGDISGNVITFNVTVNRKENYFVKITYKGIYSLLLEIYKPNTTDLIFRSNEIGQ